jgi:hypothetical protein
MNHEATQASEQNTNFIPQSWGYCSPLRFKQIGIIDLGPIAPSVARQQRLTAASQCFPIRPYPRRVQYSAFVDLN